MTTSEMSPQDAAALYERKVRDLDPSPAVEQRVREYRQEVEERAAAHH
jgi:hypothetical protein